MATRYQIPQGSDIAAIKALLRSRLREPEGVVFANGPEKPPTHVEYDPALNTTEQASVTAALGEIDTDVFEKQAAQDALASLTAYIDKPLLLIDLALTVPVVKLLCRVARWLVKRELRRTF